MRNVGQTTMTDSDPISISFNNELKDHLAAQRALYSRGRMAKMDKVVAIAAFCFGVYLVTLTGPRWWTVIWFPIAVVTWFDLLSISGLRMRIWYRSNLKFKETYHLVFSGEYIHFRTASIDSTIQWTHYERIVETPHAFLLMYGTALYTLIPKRCFDSAGSLDKFRTFVQHQIPKRAQGTQ